MRVSWAIAENYVLDPTIDIDQIKSVGPTWGSWRTWRGCNTDNVICHYRAKAHELINRAFQAVCNFYIPKKYYQDLNRPIRVKLYEGEFEQDVSNPEDIVAMHLAGEENDIVLLLGYNLAKIQAPGDAYEKHKLINYHGMIRSIIVNKPEVQWVVVDHPEEFDKIYQDVPNLTRDTMANALKLLL